MSEIKDRIEIRGLVVSRIPSWAKTYIKQRAKEEFCDDYGALISYLIRQVEEYELFKSKFLNSELMIQIVNNPQNEKTDAGVPRSICGEPIKFGGKNGKDR